MPIARLRFSSLGKTSFGPEVTLDTAAVRFAAEVLSSPKRDRKGMLR